MLNIQNLTTIGPAVSDITCLTKLDTDTRETDIQTETGAYFFRIVGVVKHRENIKMAIHRMDSITITLP